MRKCIFFMLLLLSGCSVEKGLYNIGERDIYKNGLSPDYNNTGDIFHCFRLGIKEETIPFKGAKYIYEKSYIGIENEDGTFDTLKLSRGPVIKETFLNEDDYIFMKKTYLKDGSLFYVDTFFYKFNSKKLLTGVEIRNSKWPSGNIIWKIEYSRNNLIKKVSVVNKNDSLIVSRKYDYNLLFNKVNATTFDGTNAIVTKTTYDFDRNGRELNAISHLKLIGEISKTKTKYYSDLDYIENWEVCDYNDSIKRMGDNKYSNNLMIESCINDKRNNNGNQYRFIYYTNGNKVMKERSFDFNNDQETLHFYKTDWRKKETRDIEKRIYIGPGEGIYIGIKIRKYK